MESKITQISSLKTPRSVGTHDGTFHADEVTACALLKLFDLIDEDKIVRTRDVRLLATCEYVCDVGGVYNPSLKLFDHHQVEYQGPLSSAGMILDYLYSKKKMTFSEYSYFKDNLIQGVDAHDNGKDPLIPGYCSFSHVVSNFTPVDYDCSSSDEDAAFKEAFKFVFDHIKRFRERFNYRQSCREVILSAMKNMDQQLKCLIFDKNIPWLETFFELGGEEHPALFVIMPSGNQWKLRGIPPSYSHRMEVRFALPQEWGGMLEEELKDISKIKGAIFCHKGRFISVWETKEDALKALKYTLKIAEN